MTIEELLKKRKTSTSEALRLYDSLPAVEEDFMIGRWKGFEIETGHQMDGLLVPSGWYGKLFIDKDRVHPLVFYTKNKTELYALNPKNIPLGVKFPKSKLLGMMVSVVRPFLQTKKTKARLRMIEHRGKLTATMAYDDKPIFDHFAKIDENTVLGCMDLKNSDQPYFWVMERDDNSKFKLKF